MAAVTESIDVSVPISTAFNQWTRFESFPHFLEEVEDVQQLDATRNRWRVRIGGQESESDSLISEQLPALCSDGRCGATDVIDARSSQRKRSPQLSLRPLGRHRYPRLGSAERICAARWQRHNGPRT